MTSRKLSVLIMDDDQDTLRYIIAEALTKFVGEENKTLDSLKTAGAWKNIGEYYREYREILEKHCLIDLDYAFTLLDSSVGNVTVEGSISKLKRRAFDILITDLKLVKGSEKWLLGGIYNVLFAQKHPQCLVKMYSSYLESLKNGTAALGNANAGIGKEGKLIYDLVEYFVGEGNLRNTPEKLDFDSVLKPVFREKQEIMVQNMTYSEKKGFMEKLELLQPEGIRDPRLVSSRTSHIDDISQYSFQSNGFDFKNLFPYEYIELKMLKRPPNLIDDDEINNYKNRVFYPLSRLFTSHLGCFGILSDLYNRLSTELHSSSDLAAAQSLINKYEPIKHRLPETSEFKQIDEQVSKLNPILSEENFSVDSFQQWRDNFKKLFAKIDLKALLKTSCNNTFELQLSEENIVLFVFANSSQSVDGALKSLISEVSKHEKPYCRLSVSQSRTNYKTVEVSIGNNDGDVDNLEALFSGMSGGYKIAAEALANYCHFEIESKGCKLNVYGKLEPQLVTFRDGVHMVLTFDYPASIGG